MTTQLPLSVSCLPLSYIITSAADVEGYLAQDPAAASCLPVILRDVFFMNEGNKKYGLLPNSHIPDAATTLNYLLTLWSEGVGLMQTFAAAVRNGALYLIPYFYQHIEDYVDESTINQPDLKSLVRKRIYDNYLDLPFIDAASNGHLDVIKLLIRIAKIHLPKYSFLLTTAAQGAASNGHTDIVIYLLDQDLLIPLTNIRSIINTASAAHQYDIVSALLSKYPELSR